MSTSNRPTRPASARSSSARGRAPTTPALSPEQLRRQMQVQALLRSGLTLFAVLAGLACYYGAIQLHFNQTAAAIAGFVFALLVWIASRSLARDLLLEAARRNAAETNRQQTKDNA